MKRIKLSGMTELLANRVAALDSSAPDLPADLFQLWQLCWLAHAGGCGLSENLQSIMKNVAYSRSAKSVLQSIQQGWIKARGFPAFPQYDSEFTVGDFFRMSQQLFAANPTGPAEAEFIFSFLQVTCGLPAEQKEHVLKLVAHALTHKDSRALTVVRKTFDTQWIDIADECVRFEKALYDSDHSFRVNLTLLLLPSSLQTPMSWTLRGESPNESSDIFIGWPSGLCGLSLAEQYALLAHEFEHCRQLALEAAGLLKLTVHQRELEALKCEWTQLNASCAQLPPAEAKIILKIWQETHSNHQIHIFKKDLAMYRSAVEGENANGESLPLRLPFASLNYAICAALAQRASLQWASQSASDIPQ